MGINHNPSLTNYQRLAKDALNAHVENEEARGLAEYHLRNSVREAKEAGLSYSEILKVVSDETAYLEINTKPLEGAG